MMEIAQRLGWTQGHISYEIDALRAAGYDLPYRYGPGKRNGTKYPEQQVVA
jgi:hypothetical protein